MRPSRRSRFPSAGPDLGIARVVLIVAATAGLATSKAVLLASAIERERQPQVREQPQPAGQPRQQGASQAPEQAAAPLDLVLPARLRIPPPAYLTVGGAMTGTVEALVSDAGGTTRPARSDEIVGLARLGHLGAQGIEDEREAPVKDGRFVIEDLPAGQRVVRLFAAGGIGAEMARTTLIVPSSPLSARRPREQKGFSGPMVALPGGNVLIAGPFAGAGDDPHLLVRGSPARMVWESPSAALFSIGEQEPGRTPLELRLRGAAAEGAMWVVSVRFRPPQPGSVSSRGEDISFGADVVGLPAPSRDAGGAPASWRTLETDQPILTLIFRNQTPSVVTDLWSKARRTERDKEDLHVPVFPDSAGMDGTYSVLARAKGKSRGEFRIPGSVVISDEVTSAREPLLSPPRSG